MIELIAFFEYITKIETITYIFRNISSLLFMSLFFPPTKKKWIEALKKLIHHEVKETIQVNNEATEALLTDRINQLGKYILKNDDVEENEFITFFKMYEAYKAAGLNSFIDILAKKVEDRMRSPEC